MSKKLIAGAGVVASFAVALAPLATFATSQITPNGKKDTLSVTIEKVCAFGYDTDGTENDISAGSHTDGTFSSYTGGTLTTGTQGNTPASGNTAGKGYGKWVATGDPEAITFQTYNAGDSAEPATGSPVADIAYGIMEVGTTQEDFARTTLTVVCNNDDGYQISGTTESLSSLTQHGSPAATLTIPFDNSKAVNTTDSSWNLKITATPDTSATGTITNNAAAFNSSWAGSGVLVSRNGIAAKTGDTFEIQYAVGIDNGQAADTYQGSITYVLAQL